MRQIAAPAAVLAALVFPGCLEPPQVGSAAAPSKAETHAPVMGGSTNTELQKKVAILEGILDGKISRQDLVKRMEKDFKDLEGADREKRLAELKEALENLPGDIGNGQALAEGPQRWMILGKFYFAERRFIEAAELFTKVLDTQAGYAEARNLLARCFFFLGNPDRTIQELEIRLSQLDKQQKQSGELNKAEMFEYVDALFLIGAAVAESPGASQEVLEKGKRAWTMYLEAAPNSPNLEKVRQGLQEIEAGLRGEGRLAQGPAVQAAAAMGQTQGVKGGAASFGGGPAPKTPERVKNLPENAPPYDVAMANALDKLDMRDAAGAQGFIDQARQLKPGDPMANTAQARAMILTGRTDEGLRLYGEIIKRSPDFMPAWHYNGMAHLMNGDPANAAKAWEHIQKNDPQYFQQAGLAGRLQVARRMASGR